MTTNHKWSGSVPRLAFGLLFVSVAINALQAKKIQDLVDPVVSNRTRVGHVANPIQGIGLDGRAKTITFSGGLPTVLYFFSATCRWCERNWANVSALSRASIGRFRFVGIATEKDLKAFSESRGLDFEILGGLSEDSRRALGVSGTPQTIVVSAQGRISHEWIGAFEGRRQRSVEGFFGLDLPGLLPDVSNGETR